MLGKVKLISLFAILILNSVNVFASEGYEVSKQMNEVVISPDGSEVVFKSATMKPEIILEEHLIITNKDTNKKELNYVKAIPETMFFFSFKNEIGSDKLKVSYSKDGENYHDKLNRQKDKYLKLTILNVQKEEKISVKIRYEHNIFGLRER